MCRAMCWLQLGIVQLGILQQTAAGQCAVLLGIVGNVHAAAGQCAGCGKGQCAGCSWALCSKLQSAGRRQLKHLHQPHHLHLYLHMYHLPQRNLSSTWLGLFSGFMMPEQKNDS